MATSAKRTATFLLAIATVAIHHMAAQEKIAADKTLSPYFLVENGESNMECMGKMKELVVMGYDPDQKMYTYRNFNSMGQSELSTGKVDGDTWIWTGDEHFGGMTMKGRVTMKVLSPTSYTTKFELSMDGNEWFQAMEAKSTKK